MKILLIFVPFLSIIERHEIMGDLNLNSFKLMSDHCNNTFPVKQGEFLHSHSIAYLILLTLIHHSDVILAHNLTRLSGILKNDKNAKVSKNIQHHFRREAGHYNF